MSNDRSVTEAEPSVMPVDREAWLSSINLSMFVNTYYQLRDLRRWVPEGSRVLIIGPGAGLDTLVLKWKSYCVTTFDIDTTFKPDVVGSCHDMKMFKDGEFEAVVVSHVLEHLPIGYLDRALCEISRVGRMALAYLPVAGRHAQVRVRLGGGALSFSTTLDFYNPFRVPNPKVPIFCGGQHYWEVGYRGFRKGDVRRRLLRSFEILAEYRNVDWMPSFNFVLKSRYSSDGLLMRSEGRETGDVE